VSKQERHRPQSFTHPFSGATNGSSTQGSLLLASDGKLYGLTLTGGTNNLGILFQWMDDYLDMDEDITQNNRNAFNE
jgi:geranylgeranyl pyrophosphate synthase